VGALATFNSGRFDITDNAVVIDYFNPSPLTNILSRLASGFNGGAWNGGGIVSSTAAARTNTGVGVAEATDLFPAFPATFRGQTIDATSIVLRHTLYGDANLDGSVNLADFNRLAANFGGTNKRWSQGDSDFNGNVNLFDFNRLAAHFGQTSASSPFAGTRDEGSMEQELID
jgi:hypothetical protein